MKKQMVIGQGDRAGITISYCKKDKTFDISGWYDSCVGIDGDIVSLKTLLTFFNITEKDVKKALSS